MKVNMGPGVWLCGLVVVRGVKWSNGMLYISNSNIILLRHARTLLWLFFPFPWSFRIFLRPFWESKGLFFCGWLLFSFALLGFCRTLLR